MTLLIAALVFTACMFGLGYLAAAWRYRRRALIASERMEASRNDAQGLAEALQGLQVDIDGVDPGMPRTEALFIEDLERGLHRPLPLRVRRSIRRAERAASQT
jgi:hypothetical protein